MTYDEKFELLWSHYQHQIDENRAVYKSLEELRNHVLNLYNLINRNAEISKSKPKYKIGQELWRFNHFGEIVSGTVEAIENDDKNFTYCFCDWTLNGIESNFYPSEAELIEAQIVFWLGKKESHKINQDEYCEVSG